MLAELQGRLPIRVELHPLKVDDLHRILTEPEFNLISQQVVRGIAMHDAILSKNNERERACVCVCDVYKKDKESDNAFALFLMR